MIESSQNPDRQHSRRPSEISCSDFKVESGEAYEVEGMGTGGDCDLGPPSPILHGTLLTEGRRPSDLGTWSRGVLPSWGTLTLVDGIGNPRRSQEAHGTHRLLQPLTRGGAPRGPWQTWPPCP